MGSTDAVVNGRYIVAVVWPVDGLLRMVIGVRSARHGSDGCLHCSVGRIIV